MVKVHWDCTGERIFVLKRKVLHVKVLDRKGIIYFIMKGLCILRGGKWKSFDESGGNLDQGRWEVSCCGNRKGFLLGRGAKRRKLLFVEGDSEEISFLQTLGRKIEAVT
jgi:hypothetical protein